MCRYSCYPRCCSCKIGDRRSWASLRCSGWSKWGDCIVKCRAFRIYQRIHSSARIGGVGWYVWLNKLKAGVVVIHRWEIDQWKSLRIWSYRSVWASNHISSINADISALSRFNFYSFIWSDNITVHIIALMPNSDLGSVLFAGSVSARWFLYKLHSSLV